jgi:hypothetical protein
MKAIFIFLTILLFFLLIIFGCRDIFGDRAQAESIVKAPPQASNIFVTSPTPGTIYTPGDTLSVKWIAPTIKKIVIQLYRKSEYKFTIAEKIECTGRFDWFVPIDIPISNHYLFKIINHNNENVFAYSGRFGIQ